jgi:hypothetical protein
MSEEWVNLVALNKEISIHANRKELNEAMILFRKALDQGLFSFNPSFSYKS